MALILNLETSTKVCSVALAKDSELVALKEIHDDYSHAEKLTLFIQEVLEEAGISIKELDAVAVSKGPGSYTGLRIGVSTTKGLCYSLQKPMIGIPTLKAMAREPSLTLNLEHDKAGILLCPMIDARRMEVYTAFYDLNNNEFREVAADIVDENSYQEILERHKVIFFGDGAGKCKMVLEKHENALFNDVVFPSAKNMVVLSEERFINLQFEDVAYFEPYYLKDFVAGKPKKMI